LIKATVERHWPGTDFFKMVRLVVTIPAEFTENTKVIMRQCIYDANLIDNNGTLNLQFTTEPAAIHCMKVLNDHGLKVGSTYLVVDCGGGTVDLTVRKLLNSNQLSETTERSGGFCGSTYVDKNFVKYLENKVGKYPISNLQEKDYRQYHYMIQKFCEKVKHPFTDNISEFKTFEFDIVTYCPALKNYITVVNQVIKLIRNQLYKVNECSMIFLVGGFSESKYLQSKIKQTFGNIYKIATSPNPVATVVCVYPEFQEGVDPPSRKRPDGHIYKFSTLAERGAEVEVDQEFSDKFMPFKTNQKNANIQFFYSPKKSVEYCDEPEVKLLGEFDIELPNIHLGQDRVVSVNLCFGKMEIIATVKNESSGALYQNTFSYSNYNII
ncbi:10554_t:CDS:2, partial [Cetraspora pellucida]